MPVQLNRVAFTCGGTAGHVNPAIALAQRIQEENPAAAFLFIGAERGLERDLVEKAGYPFAAVRVSNFHRSLSPRELPHNLASAWYVLRSPGEAKALLRDFRPDAVVGTGGYASYPAVRAAAALGIPAAVHEANIVPGLTTKLLERQADRVMVGFEACRANYRHPEKVIVTGMPVRGDFFRLTRQEARNVLGIPKAEKLVVSFWGSLGASGMNRVMADCLALEAEGEPFRHIHAAGKQGYPVLMKALEERGVDLTKHPALEVRPYIYDMAVVMRAADLVICRAGASTLGELTALGMPALLVPSPYVTNHHQEKTAKALEDAGGAVTLAEPGCTGQLLYETTLSILSDETRLRRMSAAQSSLYVGNATERILDTIRSI